jgi:4-hydroxybenzoate polyprenyltransferase
MARLSVSAISGGSVAIFAVITGRLGAPAAAGHSLVMTLITMSAFVANDIVDSQQDRAAGRVDKPLAMGSISREASIAFLCLLMVVSVAIAWPLRTEKSFQIAAVTLLGGIGYSYAAKALAWTKNIITALLVLFPLMYASEVTHVSVPPSVYVYLAFFVTGRELLMDAVELPADLACGKRTLAYYLDGRTSRIAAWALMSVCVLLPAMTMSATAQVLFTTAEFILLICFVVWIRDEERGILWTRLVLLCGTFAIAFASSPAPDNGHGSG